MDEKEISDLSQYFRLTRFRDEGDLFLEEYQELEDIIRRNPMAQLMEEDHFQYLRSEEHTSELQSRE